MEKVVCFDLDDTLYKEIDFLKSGYKAVSDFICEKVGCGSQTIFDIMYDWYITGETDVFKKVNMTYGIDVPKEEYLRIYRNHMPSISPVEDAISVLTHLKEKGCKLAIITDGRSVTQRNKIDALGIMPFFDKIVISEEFGSEKIEGKSFEYLMTLWSNSQYYYIGDNPMKDFVKANSYGWETICLQLNDSIHKQNTLVPQEFKPHRYIRTLAECMEIITDNVL